MSEIPPVTYEQWLLVKKLFKPRETQQQEEEAQIDATPGLELPHN